MLTFDSATHAYAYEGRPVPSVTQVIASAGLIDGSAWMTEEHRLRGQAVHRACELDDAMALDEETVDSVIAPYLKAWRALRMTVAMVVRGSEERVYHDAYGYAGTLDRRAEIRIGRRRVSAVIDLKTGGRQRATGVQLAAYQKAVGQPWTHRYGAYLQDDGRFDLVEYNDPRDFPTFLAALSIHNWKTKP